jgi:hypothetical protein
MHRISAIIHYHLVKLDDNYTHLNETRARSTYRIGQLAVHLALGNAVFESLAEERSEGYGARTVHGIIWACLKARKVQSEIQLKGIGGHNIVTNVLNQQLQASAVMKSEYEKGMLDITKQMESLRKEMEAVSRKADQAVT